MIEIRVDKADEARILDRFISTGILNSRKEDIEECHKIIGKELNLNYRIKEYKNKWWKKLLKKSKGD